MDITTEKLNKSNDSGSFDHFCKKLIVFTIECDSVEWSQGEFWYFEGAQNRPILEIKMMSFVIIFSSSFISLSKNVN